MARGHGVEESTSSANDGATSAGGYGGNAVAPTTTSAAAAAASGSISLLESLVGKVEKTSSLNKYLKILRKRSHQRTEQEVNFLVSGTSQIGFLNANGPGVNRDLCRVLKVKHLNKYESLKLNEFSGWGHCFYWILSGRVTLRTHDKERHVVYSVGNQGATGSSKSKSKLKRSDIAKLFDLVDTDHSGAIDTDEIYYAFSLIGVSVNRSQIQDLMDQYDEDFSGEITLNEFEQIMNTTLADKGLLEPTQWTKSWEHEGEHTMELRKDFCFGEDSILKNEPLDCVLMATDPADIVCLEKSEFERILEKGFDGTLAQKIAILNKIPLIKELVRHSDLKALAFTMRKESILKGTMIIHEGHRPDALYFIVSGECKLLQKVPKDMQKEFVEKHKARPLTQGAFTGSRGSPRRRGSATPSKFVSKLKAGKDVVSKELKHNFINRQFEIGLVGTGSFVGEACLFGPEVPSMLSALGK